MMKRQFTVTDGNYTATVRVSWAETNKYVAYIKTPFKSGITHNLFVYNEAKIDEAVAIATDYAKDELMRCTLI